MGNASWVKHGGEFVRLQPLPNSTVTKLWIGEQYYKADIPRLGAYYTPLNFWYWYTQDSPLSGIIGIRNEVGGKRCAD